jgi:hypothetical protein
MRFGGARVCFSMLSSLGVSLQGRLVLFTYSLALSRVVISFASRGLFMSADSCDLS